LKPEWWGSPLVQKETYQEKPVQREEEIITIIIRRRRTTTANSISKRIHGCTEE
jgi:hypothetical protein